MLQVQLEFLNLHVVVLCESPRCVPEIRMGVYNLAHFMFLAVTRSSSPASCLCTTLVVLYDYTVEYVILVEEAS